MVQRTPAEIDEMFEKGVPLRKFKGHVTDVQQQVAQPNLAYRQDNLE